MPKRSRSRPGSEVKRRREIARFDSFSPEQKIFASSPVEIYYRNQGKVKIVQIMEASLITGIKKEQLITYMVHDNGRHENERFIIRSLALGNW